MAGKRLIIKDEVLEFAALDGHCNRAMRRIHGRDDALPSLLEFNGLLVANPRANAATETNLFVDLGFLACVVARISRGNHAHRFHRTSVRTFHAAGTFVVSDCGQEVSSADGIENGESLSCQHRFATATTAIADK